MNNRELNTWLHEALIGSLKPHRDHALVRVGPRHVACTGLVWKLRTGDELPIPDGATLRQPTGLTNWNDRYYLYVGEFLAEKYPHIAQEVEDYRLSPQTLSTTYEGMGLVIEAMTAKGWTIMLHERQDGEYEFGFSKYDDVEELIERTRQAPRLPAAVALAAKAALEGEK